MAKTNIIQVFEYSWLIVHEKYGPQNDTVFKKDHFDLLAQYLTSNPGCNYYSVYLNRIRFANYVGVIKVGNLVIEVLPKTDRHEADKATWQKVLLQMLAISLEVKAKATTHANIVLKNHSVLDTYFYLFLKEVDTLLRQGLVKKYRTDVSNQTALKGKLLIHQHVSKNLVHSERFYVAHQVYDRDNIYNAIINEALYCIKSLSVSDSIIGMCKRILIDFPQCRPLNVSEKLFQRLTYDRKTERYRTAIELARIILLNYHPDIKGGANNILAIMFDMNLLWEAYIYRMLLWASKDTQVKCSVSYQNYTSFWQHPDRWTMHLVPDIVVEKDKNEKIVLDTKWKYQSNTSPEDVRQLYAYGNYFGAKKRYLLYPDRRKAMVEKKEGTFFDHGSKMLSTDEGCGLIYIDLLLEDNTLNTNIGKEILKAILFAGESFARDSS